MAAGTDLPRWAKLDAGFLSRSHTNRVLVDTFGAAGPMVFLLIILECELSENGRATDTIEVYYGPTARACGCTPDDVKNVIRALVELGKAEATASPPRPRCPWERDAPAPSRSMIVRLLDRPRWAPEARREPQEGPLRARPPRLRRVPPDERVIAALVNGPLHRGELAEAAGVVDSGSFRARLKRLRDSGKIHAENGVYGLAD